MSLRHDGVGATSGDAAAIGRAGPPRVRRKWWIGNAGTGLTARRLALVLLAATVLAGVACGTDSGATRESVIVGRVAEWFVPGTARAWVPIEPEEISAGIVEVLSRFRITIRDPLGSPVTYDVRVSAACFATLRVGDAWPAPPEACR